LINLDFADVKSIMKGMGMAFMGTGIASGDNRAVDAAQKAISSPLLEEKTIEGAHGVLINITGGTDMTLHEVSKASQLIYKMAHPEANIIFGTVIDETMNDKVKVTVIATGFETAKSKENLLQDSPAPQNLEARSPAQAKREPTPPYELELKGNEALWKTPPWEKQWEFYETPPFIRNKHANLKKPTHEIS